MAPEVWTQNKTFDARQADAWSLGVVLFMMMTGAPCYGRPDIRSDVYFQYVASGKMSKMLRLWQRAHYGNPLMMDLLRKILVVNPQKRYTIRQIRDHPWLK